MTEDAWNKFSTMLDGLVLKNQILIKLYSISNISSKNHLNCLWSHWRDLVIKAADVNIPHVMTFTEKSDYVPKDLKNIQKSIRAINTILKQFKKCFVTKHDNINTWPPECRQELLSVMNSIHIDDQHWYDVISHNSSVSQLHRIIKKILNSLLV